MNGPSPERVRHKDDVLHLMAAGHDHVAFWIAQLSEGERAAAPAEGGWGAKATLAHMARWNLALLTALELHARGGPVPFQWQDVEAENARLLQLSPGRTWAEVSTEAERAYATLRGWVERLSEEELQAADDFAWQERAPLWQTFLGNTFSHYLEHLAAFYDAAGQPEQAAALRAEMREVHRSRGLDWYS